MNDKEENYLVKLLVEHNINLNEEIDEQRSKIKYYRDQNIELKTQNDKLKKKT